MGLVIRILLTPILAILPGILLVLMLVFWPVVLWGIPESDMELY